MARVDYTTIETILNELNAQYSRTLGSADVTLPVAYSKLALLEMSGWIEESVDTILYNYIDNKILDVDCRDRVRGIIEHNYSFDYKHLYHIFICALGVNNWENIIDAISQARISVLATKCNEYKRKRNDAAHTYQLVTATYSAPSQVITDFHTIQPILFDIEQEIIKLI